MNRHLATFAVATLLLASAAAPVHAAPPRAATMAPVPVPQYLAATVDGVKIVYREAGRRTRRSCCCCTGSRPRRTCSATSSRAGRPLPRRSRPTIRASAQSDAPDHDQVRLHLRPLCRRGGRAARAARCQALRHVRDGLRRAGRIPARAEASGAGERPDRPERQRLRGGPREEFWDPIKAYWADRTEANREALSKLWSRPRPRSSSTPTAWRDLEPASTRTTGSTTRRCSTGRATRTSSSTCSTTTAATCRCTRNSRRSSASTSRRR